MNPVKINGKLPKLKEDLIPYMDSLGYDYEGRNIFGRHLFISRTKRLIGQNNLDFSLRELREAYHYGF